MHDAHTVHEELLSIAKTRHELYAREARLLVRAEELELWSDHGCVTMFEYLEKFCDLQPRTAREHLRVARALAGLPVMAALLDVQDIKYSTVRELTRIATAETEVAWLRAIAGLSARAVEEAVAGHKPGDGPGDPKDPNRLVKLVLEVRESTVTAFFEARARFKDERGDDLSDDEAVLALCREVPEISDTATDVDGDAVAEPTAAGGSPSYQTSITTCRSCARSFLLAAGREVAAPCSLVAAAQCDAMHIGDLESDAPQRAWSSVTSRMRRQVLARDHHRCTVPGCRSTRFLDVHHIEPKEHGGPNKPSNLTTTCFGHHHRLHEGKLAVTGRAPHRLVWTWPGDATRTSTRDRTLAAHVGRNRK